jgi:hypothetical protein
MLLLNIAHYTILSFPHLKPATALCFHNLGETFLDTLYCQKYSSTLSSGRCSLYCYHSHKDCGTVPRSPFLELSFQIAERGWRGTVARTCLGREWGRRTKMNRIKRRREGDDVPSEASAARPPHVRWRRRVLSARKRKADGR